MMTTMLSFAIQFPRSLFAEDSETYDASLRF